MKQTETRSVPSRSSEGTAPHGVELRHLRYFVAVADAGTFTHAAQRMFIAQPTLSQQVRRLEEMVGAPLLQRQREGGAADQGRHRAARGVPRHPVFGRAGSKPDPAGGRSWAAPAAGSAAPQ